MESDETRRELNVEDDSVVEHENEEELEVRGPVDELMDAIDKGNMLKVSFLSSVSVKFGSLLTNNCNSDCASF